MAKKEHINLIDTFSEFKDLKSIDRSTLISVVEESFRNVISKNFGTDENFDVIINPDKGDFEIYRNRIVVPDDEIENENMEIGLSEAQKIDEEVATLIKESVNRAEIILKANKKPLEALTKALLEKETIDENEVNEILKGAKLPEEAKLHK